MNLKGFFGSHGQNLDNTKEFNKIVEDCLLRHHTDMFFRLVFRQIIYVEYEKNGILFSANLKEVFDKYLKLTSFILKITSNILMNDYSRVIDSDKLFFKQYYQDVLEHASLYQKVISTYVINRKQIQEIIDKEVGSENFYFSFYSSCMKRGYQIALSGLSDLNDKNYFSHTLVTSQNATVIKVFPTAYGFLMKKKLVDLIMAKKLHEVLNEYLSENNITIIQDPKLQATYQTDFVYKVQSFDGLFYYRRRRMDLEYAPFGEQDRVDPFRALIIQGQINLTFEPEAIDNNQLKNHRSQVLNRNPLSKSLRLRLENAFEEFKKNTVNPMIIAQLKNKEYFDQVYLIAKDPDSEMYYGIRENEFISEKRIMGIPFENLVDIGLEEVIISPFRAKPYIESDIKS